MNKDFCYRLTDDLLPLAAGIFFILAAIAILANEVML
jgi:hypothetical protein